MHSKMLSARLLCKTYFFIRNLVLEILFLHNSTLSSPNLISIGKGLFIDRVFIVKVFNVCIKYFLVKFYFREIESCQKITDTSLHSCHIMYNIFINVEAITLKCKGLFSRGPVS